MGKNHCTVDLLFDWFGISCMTTYKFCFYLQNRLIQTSQTEVQQYSDTSPFGIPLFSLQDRFGDNQARPKVKLRRKKTLYNNVGSRKRNCPVSTNVPIVSFGASNNRLLPFYFFVLTHQVLKLLRTIQVSLLKKRADIFACVLDFNFKRSKLTRINFQQAYFA